MNALPQYKIGDCIQCGDKDVPCVKVGKELFCKFKCHSNNKAKVQTAKANERNKIRSLKVGRTKADELEIEDKVKKENWFRLIREKLTGTCQCGCGNKSSKNDDIWFRSSCCHIFPKSKFDSVKYHLLNYAERAFWGGCHSVMDDTSMERWPGMADWDDIKAKFYILEPLLTEEEKSFKFYTQLKKLVTEN